jgi:hypothetical protein
MTPEGVAPAPRKPERDETLVKALVRAHRWRRRIESGQARSITDLAEQEGVTVEVARFGRSVFASSAFSAALARCSFFAAASTSLRLVAASSSRSASRSSLVQ